MFTIHKSHKATTIDISRGSPLGNPFHIGQDGDREQVIGMYRNEVFPGLVDTPEMRSLIHKHQCGEHLRLDCYCAPLHCHGDVIAEYIRKQTGTQILRVIVAGSRDAENVDSEHHCSLAALSHHVLGVTGGTDHKLVEIISGRARGIDRLGELFASEQRMVCRHFPADWDNYGNSAGPIRNKLMAEYAIQEKPALVAFWTGQEYRSGTYNMIKTAAKYNIPTTIVRI